MHIALHFIVPLVIALTVFYKHDDKHQWAKVFLLMMASMLIDLDHLLANPIYDPNRCSVGFHPLHSLYPICLYFVACFYKKTRWLGIGLMIHIILDSIDCQMTNGVWWV